MEKAQSEIAQIAAGNVLSNADFVKRLVKGEPGKAEKLLAKIVQIKNALTSNGATNAETAFVRKAERLFLNAIDELGGTYRNGKIHLANREEDEGDALTRENSEKMQVGGENGGESAAEDAPGENKKSPAEGEIKYSLSKNAPEELHKALYDTTYRSDVLLRDVSPAIMLAQKGVKNLPMAMKASHIRENVFTEIEAKKLGLPVNDRTHYHGLGEKFFLQIIDGLDNVKEGYRGTKNATNPARRENYFLLVSKFKDAEKNVINVPVYIDEYADINRVFVDVNKISTAFGKTDFYQYVQREIKKGNLVRIKNRSTLISERDAPIAPDYEKDASNISITESEPIVKPEAQENSGEIKFSRKQNGDTVTIAKGELPRAATENAQFSTENDAESVDEDGELRYNKRTVSDEKAGTDYLIHNFSGEVKYDPETMPLSDQELAVISSAVKTGWGKLNTSNKYGYVFSSENYYAFIYDSDNSITVTRRLDIDTHREVINIARGIVKGDTSTKRKIGDLRSWLAFLWNERAGYRYNADDGVQQFQSDGSPDPMDGGTRGSNDDGDLARSGGDRQNGQITPLFVGYYDDMVGNRRKVYDLGEGRFQVENARGDTAEYYSSPEAAIEAENESFIKGYAKEFFLSPSEVKRKLEADPDLLSRAQDNGILFSRKPRTDGQAARDHANHNYGKIYTKKDAREIISDALTAHLTFADEGVFGTLVGKSRTQAIERLWIGLNAAFFFIYLRVSHALTSGNNYDILFIYYHF